MAFCLIWFPKRKRYFMDFFNALIHNTVFMSAVTGWFAAQVIKTVIYTCITKSFDPERLVGSGGMHCLRPRTRSRNAIWRQQL